MTELRGVLAAVLSSALGGTAVAATRYVIDATDALTLGAFRFGIGFVLLLAIARLLPTSTSRWPARGDWPATLALGLLFFGLFPILFNAALQYTTAARGALALSTLPLLTMLVGAAVGVEALDHRKSAGVLLAMAGVALALLSGLSTAPPRAWQGDLLMLGAALCMAFYNIGSRSIIRRCGPIPFTLLAMGAGSLGLVVAAAARGGFVAALGFGALQWLAVVYLGVFGGAIGFYLWAYALERTTPTRVAISVTVNPVTASLVAAVLLDEAIHWNLVIGLLMVAGGIWLATTLRGRRAAAAGLV
ncbi:MAG: DMT family transporter [Caldimonas sp.]